MKPRSVTAKDGMLIFEEEGWCIQCSGTHERSGEDTKLMAQIIMGWLTYTLDALALTMELSNRSEFSTAAG